MRPVDADMLSLLSEMPFLDRLEMAYVSGWSRGAAYRAVPRLEDAGLIASLSHGTETIAPTLRYHVTARGLRILAREEDADQEDLLRDLPVSARWRRVLLERLDAAAVINRIVSAMSIVARPVRFIWYRAMPVDAGVFLPGGRSVGIVRQGPTTDRTGFSKRLWRLEQGPLPGVVLMLMPDEVRLRYARRLLVQTSVPALFALERYAAEAGPDEPVWRLRSVKATITLREAVEKLERRGRLPFERPLARVSIPPDIDESAGGKDVPGWLLPALLKPAGKRALDLLYDWPWLRLKDLAGLLGVSRPRASQLVTTLEGFGLVVRVQASGGRLALTDPGLAMLARRDRASVGQARKRWSVAPVETGDRRNVSGRRSRQLLRELEHTTAVHSLIAALARQARELGWEIAQLDPPIRASRYFRHLWTGRSIHPDAFGMLRRSATTWPFFLEWERRAVRPVTMRARLAPYLRYYSTHRPIDDHGVRPAVLVAFDNDLAATQFLRVAAEEMVRKRTPLPLLVSHMGLMEREGPLGRAWLGPGGGFEPVRPLNHSQPGERQP